VGDVAELLNLPTDLALVEAGLANAAEGLVDRALSRATTSMDAAV
jgi:hypothetical protein